MIRRDFDDRPLIHLARISIIITNSKNNDDGCNQARPVHMRRIRIYRCREEAENNNDGTVANRECIEHDTPDTRNVEGAPYEFVGVPVGAAHFTGFPDIATNTAPEEEGLGDCIGGVEGGDTDGEDNIKSGGGADVNNANEAGDAGHNVNGVVRYGGFGVHLVGRRIR